jgi:hypothetical protein
MAIFEAIGEFVIRILLESALYSAFDWVTGKNKGINGYRTQQKKFINFDVAKKFILTWEVNIEHLRGKLTEGLELLNEETDIKDFHFITIKQKTIIHPPASISFYSFYFLVQCLDNFKIETVGIVETARTSYATYNDPNSENLIGQTDKGKKFFISLMEDYAKRQFLRINRNIETIDDFEVQKIKSELKYSQHWSKRPATT